MLLLLVVVMYFACFFFFKQKTAYEMSVSDWSSDVCSSDLTTAQEDRRSVGPWGAFLGGQVAIGGNLFVAIGLVAVAAQGAAGIAFLLAGCVFVLIGLCYVEMASALPVSGGGYYFVLRGLGDLAGFVAGAALILDLTIGIALFASMSASYANTFTPALLGAEASALSIRVPGVGHFEWLWFAESLAMVLALVTLNARG